MYINKEDNVLLLKVSRITGHTHESARRWWTDLSEDERNDYRENMKKIVSMNQTLSEYPIKVDKNGKIVDGHVRYHAAKSLGFTDDQISTEVIDTED